MASRGRNEEDLEEQFNALAEELERVRGESQSYLEAMNQARKEADHYKGRMVISENRCTRAEEEKERYYEESQQHLAVAQEAKEKTMQYKSQAERREKEITGLQTDLSTSVGVSQTLESELGELKIAFSKVADRVKHGNGDKVDTARMLVQKMKKLRQLDNQLENELTTEMGTGDQEGSAEETASSRVPPEWEQAEESGFLGLSLDDELENCDQRRGFDNDSPRLSSDESVSSQGTSLFDADRTRDGSPPTDQSDDDDDDDDDEKVDLSRTKSVELASQPAWDYLNNTPDHVPSSESSPPEPKKQEHPEFRLDLLEQSGPRKRARIREIQDKALVKEPNPWKGGQKSRLPVNLVKDLSRLTLQGKSDKKPTKPSAKQVMSFVKQLPGNSHTDRFKHLRPDRFKRSKREKPSVRDSAAVEYTVVVDPAMAQDTNMFGDQVPANQSARQSTQTVAGNSSGIHGNMFAPEVLAPPVPVSQVTTTSTANVANSNAPLQHSGPWASPPKPQPIAQPLRKYKPLGPPKDSPRLPRIVRHNYPGAIYRPTPYGQGATRLDLPWAAWMTKIRGEKKQASSAAAGALAQTGWEGWDFDVFQQGAGSADLLPEQRRVLLKWRIVFVGIVLLFLLWLFTHSEVSINDRDRWMEVNDVPRSVLRHMRGQPRLNYRWMDILDYEMVRWSGIDRVALG
ncbi:uncharacterized protein LDX57_010899 [Aspergillus melleus]|uniref:uncharacterized protein n=1 Tax=Aspergillus melleus TaxID=138277 RepID=UPI001E8D11C9|nr:uncharacterized protein LDX57_010899 [Aspergillus melleus]KAH8433264.1 hypothetical protein LDX57_010899 [Aspergillus melleus]